RPPLAAPASPLPRGALLRLGSSPFLRRQLICPAIVERPQYQRQFPIVLSTVTNAVLQPDATTILPPNGMPREPSMLGRDPDLILLVRLAPDHGSDPEI